MQKLAPSSISTGCSVGGAVMTPRGSSLGGSSGRDCIGGACEGSRVGSEIGASYCVKDACCASLADGNEQEAWCFQKGSRGNTSRGLSSGSSKGAVAAVILVALGGAGLSIDGLKSEKGGRAQCDVFFSAMAGRKSCHNEAI